MDQHRLKDPIDHWERSLLDQALVTEEERTEVWDCAREEVSEAIRFAEASPLPRAETALDAVFAGKA